MKKLFAIMLVLIMALSLAACAGNNDKAEDTSSAPAEDASSETTEDAAEETTEDAAEESTAMTYAEYAAAELDSEVVVEFYVQNSQGWWFDDEAGHGKMTVYGQDKDGGYFGYDLNVAEEDAAKMVPGTKIRVTGYKSEWSGEVEITDGTVEFVEGADTYVAEAKDVTELLGTDELINYQNMFASFNGLTVENVSYKNDEPGDDIYLTLGYNGASYDFCVEVYLTGTESDVYKTVGSLETGDVVNVEGFLYWYEGVNPHITAISVAE